MIRWKNDARLFLSHTLRGETVGLEELGEGAGQLGRCAEERQGDRGAVRVLPRKRADTGRLAPLLCCLHDTHCTGAVRRWKWWVAVMGWRLSARKGIIGVAGLPGIRSMR